MNRDKLVEKMLEKWFDPTSGDMSCVEGQCKRMSAALDVAVAELLGEPSEDEILLCAVINYAGSGHVGCVKKAFANRRAQLEKVKTPEQRVTVDGCRVFIDGMEIASAVNDATACMIMTGLVAQFKAGEK